jgi:hypothetical protein
MKITQIEKIYIPAIIILCFFMTPITYAQQSQIVDPFSFIEKWEPTKGKNDVNGCMKRAKKLAYRLSKTKDCQLWTSYWFEDMKCAVSSGLLPSMISFCYEYKNDIAGATKYYETLMKRYGNSICQGDEEDDYGSETCSEIAKRNIKRLSSEYSQYPTNIDKMVNEMFLAIKSKNKQKILMYFLKSEQICLEPGACHDLEDFINEEMPVSFEVLYTGFQKEDPMNPRQKDIKPLPCVASGQWGEWGTLSFQVMPLLPRIDQPQRYHFVLLHGGCAKK